MRSRRKALTSALALCAFFTGFGCGSSEGPSGLDAGEDAAEDSAVEPTCDDGVHNGDEEGVDCGGSCDDPCPACDDGVHNGDEDDVDCGGSCDPCPECEAPEECGSGICEEGACVTSQAVPCVDAAPEGATSVEADVIVEWDEESGWGEPAECAWECDDGYCEEGGGCAAAAPTAFAFEIGTNSFGTVSIGAVNSGASSRGAGQSFTPETDIRLEEFAIRAQNSSGDAVFLRFQLWDAGGVELARAETTLPAPLSREWFWFDVGADLTAGETYVATVHAPLALTDGQTAPASAYVVVGGDYEGGSRYAASTTDEGTQPLEEWARWSPADDDLEFQARGTLPCGE